MGTPDIPAAHALGQVDPALKLLKPRRLAGLIQGHDLAVQQDWRLESAAEGIEPPHKLRELRGLVISQARPDRYPSALVPRQHLHQRTNAVILWFIDELRVQERSLLQSGQHRTQILRVCMPAGEGLRLGRTPCCERCHESVFSR